MPMKVPQTEVPIEFRRKALEHLESVRETEMAPAGTETAEIVGDVCPIYRPDVEGVAYWEFEVALAGAPASGMLATSAAAARGELLENAKASAADRSVVEDRGLEGRGFIMVATGEHDFPVPHWSLQRPPVSRQLEVEAEDGGESIARIYKLDALAYVAESEAGNPVGRSGQTPVPVEGLGHDLGRQAGAISSLTAKPTRDVGDEGGRAIKHTASRSGPKPPELRASDPERWSTLKERYADAFGPFLDVLRRRAAKPWKVDKLVAEFGEGVIAGEQLAVALLHQEAAVEVTGEGAGLVDLELDETRGRKPRLRVHARRSPRERETDFELRIRYGNGEEETLRYFITSRDTPSNVRSERRLQGDPE